LSTLLFRFNIWGKFSLLVNTICVDCTLSSDGLQFSILAFYLWWDNKLGNWALSFIYAVIVVWLLLWVENSNFHLSGVCHWVLCSVWAVRGQQRGLQKKLNLLKTNMCVCVCGCVCTCVHVAFPPKCLRLHASIQICQPNSSNCSLVRSMKTGQLL
jgi:hypothetical protein